MAMVTFSNTYTKLINFLIVLLIAAAPIFAAEPILQKGQSFGLRLTGVPADDQTSISQTYTISDNGTIKLLYLEEMSAAGMKPSQLMRKVEQAYVSAEIFTKPNVVITLGEAGSIQRYVSVLGEVNTRRGVSYTPGLTLLEAIAQCGGFSDFANPKRVKLTREGKATIHDLSRTTSNANVKLQPNDIITVPARGLFRGG